MLENPNFFFFSFQETYNTWKKVTFLVAVPAVAIISYSVFSHEEHPSDPKAVPRYSYLGLRIRVRLSAPSFCSLFVSFLVLPFPFPLPLPISSPFFLCHSCLPFHLLHPFLFAISVFFSTLVFIFPLAIPLSQYPLLLYSELPLGRGISFLEFPCKLCPRSQPWWDFLLFCSSHCFWTFC